MADQTTQRIFAAIDAGDIPAVRALLDADAGLVNVQHVDATVYDNRPLAYAASRGHLELSNPSRNVRCFATVEMSA